MEAGKLRWRDRLALLAKAPSTRMARQVAFKWQEHLTPEQLEALNRHAVKILSEVDYSKVPHKIANMLFSGEAVLANPFLVHYVRPAVRMARTNGYEIANIPIITNPSLTFGGMAVELAPNLRVAELPFGLIFMLREIGRGIVSLNNAMQKGKFEKSKVSAYLCATISLLMFEPLAKIYPILQNTFESTTSFSDKILATRATHALGVFLILHEIGHICCHHKFGLNENDERREMQEHEADVFAVECILAAKAANQRVSPFKDAMLIYICGLFVLMDISANETGLNLDGYPSFKSRYLRILEDAHASTEVRETVEKMGFEVQMAIKPASERVEIVKGMNGL
ncbi:ImmA/IrrE family metallo-endopeptidase [Rhizobium leguminosarum]|uniref:ImmA/IrrE family metallo-endopeptidase n=1 Tax=Rhizobium leguminosarum TaxID=384 RepID=UPI001C98E281|nr:ImmA/IrrE family metallo-endopeptidase [Rhizobium leguminosarum]MBY5694687.1 ImmA/IrrE family metallo-endopeptidase [Rhizobium leguminosarum]